MTDEEMNRDVKEHFHLNAKDYNEKIGTGEHGMMHYGDHSSYERRFFEKILSKTGLLTLSEIKQAVPYRVEALVEKADIDENDVVLDSGCGRGGNSIWIAEKTGADVIGLDIDDQSLEEAREKAEKKGLSDKIDFIHGNFDDLPVEDFDVYFAIESQCYSEDEKQLLEQIYEAMNKGGRMIISDGFRTKRFDEKDERVSEKMHLGWGVDYLAHNQDFEDFTREAGFENIDKERIREKIYPTSLYLHRIALISRPYVLIRRKISSLKKKFAQITGFGDVEEHKYQFRRYDQLNDLITTCEYQYIALKTERFDQFDFYAEKK